MIGFVFGWCNRVVAVVVLVMVVLVGWIEGTTILVLRRGSTTRGGG